MKQSDGSNRISHTLLHKAMPLEKRCESGSLKTPILII